MALFIKKSVIFSIIFLMVCIGIDFLSIQPQWQPFIDRITNSEDFFTNNYRITECINNVRRDPEKNKLIVGDSVCRQIFSPMMAYYPDAVYAADNSGVLSTGYYMLISEYIKYHPHATDIYLMVTPKFLFHYFDINYQYSIVPFAKADLLYLLDDNALKLMGSAYGDFFVRPETAKTIGSSGLSLRIYLKSLPKNSFGITEDLSKVYLPKISELCSRHNIKLHIYPNPVSVRAKRDIEAVQNIYKDKWLTKTYPEFLPETKFYPEDYFVRDQIHLNTENRDLNFYKDIIRTNFPNTYLSAQLDNAEADKKTKEIRHEH